jgi:hypothetical protein
MFDVASKVRWVAGSPAWVSSGMATLPIKLMFFFSVDFNGRRLFSLSYPWLHVCGVAFLVSWIQQCVSVLPLMALLI